MADYIRRLVSGNKARFKDEKLNLELDLVYITDQVIIMGYPAAGIEGLYRNRREDAKKFLEHRHGKNFWVFNFCPIKENSYDAIFFGGRVSRYPFPDHHAPPLAIMPLVAREMRAWLNGSLDRVAVLHCKAGKGRSGTMACAYLLSLDDGPTPPRLDRSLSAKELAKVRADNVMQAIPEDIDDAAVKELSTSVSDVPESTSPSAQSLDPTDHRTESPTPMAPVANTTITSKSYTNSLKDVLDLHTSQRMRRSSSPGKGVKQGVSIPSQRRWLYYWSLLLSHEAPPHLWATPSAPKNSQSQLLKRPKVRLTQIKLRMKASSSVKMGLVRAANIVIDHTSKGKSAASANGKGNVWVSLARYDDDLVDLLEQWEAHTRDNASNDGGVVHMGQRKLGSDHTSEEELLSGLFKDGKWDKTKMVRSFARLGARGGDTIVKQDTDADGKAVAYTLRPLPDTAWEDMKSELRREQGDSGTNPKDTNVLASETNSMDDVATGAGEEGVILDAGREVRIKLYMGQVFMGWFWFIPTFHMHAAPPSAPTTPPPQTVTKFCLTRKELDFALGIGSDILDVEVSLEWLRETDAGPVQPPAKFGSGDPMGQAGTQSTGAIAAVQFLTAGDLGEVVEAKQASEQ